MSNVLFFKKKLNYFNNPNYAPKMNRPLNQALMLDVGKALEILNWLINY